MMDGRSKFPAWVFKILRWFCKEWYVEAIEGDVYELFQRDNITGKKFPKFRAFFNVIRFLRLRFIKDMEEFQPKSSFGMYKNYFKISLRNIKKNFTQTFINVFGLSIGITSCLLILMHVKEQSKYDKHIQDFERVYRVRLNENGPYTPARLVKQMQEEIPGIASGTRTSPTFEGVFEINGEYIAQDAGIIGDSTFFDVFPAKFIHGAAKEALNDPNDLVLTREVAARFFPNQNPVGMFVTSDGENYQISAVIEDSPKTTTLPYQFVVSIPHAEWATTGWWTGNNFYSYVKLDQGKDPGDIEARLTELVEKYVGPEMLSFYPDYTNFDEYLKDGHTHTFHLVPLSEIHLHHPRLTLGKPGSFQNLVVFSVLAVFILVIASINYVNMATARSSLRSKEIGLRKVMGAIKAIIIKQFLFESFLITAVAFVLGVGLSIISLPYFNLISESNYSISELFVVDSIGWYLMLFLITGILAGVYPAFYLSGLRPITAIKGQLVGGKERLRSYLVVFQFAISILLIGGTYIVFKQVELMRNRKLGLDADQILVLEGGNIVSDHFEAFKAELLTNPNISNAGISNSFPSGFLADWNYTSEGSDLKIAPYNIYVTSEMLDVWGLNLSQGRFFDKEMKSDTLSVVVNEQLVQEMGWKEPIGQILKRGVDEKFSVIGVVQNFATGSAKRGDASILFRYSAAENMGQKWGGNFIMVKISGDIPGSLIHVEEIWNKFSFKYPMNAYFLDDSFERLYQEERTFGYLFTGFSLLAIFIACSGLFALASFTMDRRRREIALRKVMGAQIQEIFLLVSRDFGRLIVVSACLALPTLYYFSKNWLEDYVERIEISFVVLSIPFVVVLIVALLTTSFHTYHASTCDPINALKDE